MALYTGRATDPITRDGRNRDMRFFVLFQAAELADGAGAELRRHVESFEAGRVERTAELAEGVGLAALVEAPDREAVEGWLRRVPRLGGVAVEVVPLDGADFPVSFGRWRGQLATWEKLMSAR
jgi:hypothetical protein